MKKSLFLFFILLPFLFGGSVLGADLQKGNSISDDVDLEATLEETTLRAEQGDAVAQFKLGEMYYEGKRVRQDDKIAIEWFTLAADQGNADAQADLGLMHSQGRGVSRDGKAGIEWYRLAAKQGNAKGQYILGLMYYNGFDVPEDRKLGFKWYTLAAEQGNAAAQFRLGLMYLSGKDIPQDDHAAVKWIMLAGNQGDTYAQYKLGQMYSEGAGVPQDDQAAADWFTLAAKQGHSTAQLKVGEMYSNGKGVSQDYVLAHMWFNLAAANNGRHASGKRSQIAKKMSSADVAHAQMLAWSLGDDVLTVGMKKTFAIVSDAGVKTYLNNLTLQAEQGDVEIRYDLGEMNSKPHLKEPLVRLNYKLAVTWYEMAAEQGHAGAQAELGRMYKNGWGIPQNYVLAIRWLLRAIEQGDSTAQVELGVMYHNGRGVEQNNVRAYMWFNVASFTDSYRAGKTKDQIAENMSFLDVVWAWVLTLVYFVSGYTGV